MILIIPIAGLITLGVITAFICLDTQLDDELKDFNFNLDCYDIL